MSMRNIHSKAEFLTKGKACQPNRIFGIKRALGVIGGGLVINYYFAWIKMIL